MGARIITRQRTARELGRLRTGYSQPSEDPNKRPRPVKSRTWVVTSHAEHYVQAAAEQWGGTVERWQPQGTGPEQWRVITEAEAIDALLPPGDPLSQYNEMWSKGGCQRRCDGQRELISRRSCLCEAEHGEFWYQMPKGTVCSVTSRISVVLPDLPDVGVWRAETHSFYASGEWPSTVDMVLAGTGGKGLVPVRLRIEPRQRVASGMTKRFPVVAVEVRGLTPRQALSGPIPTSVALNPSGDTGPRALEAPRSSRPDYTARAEAGLTAEDVRDVWREARAAGHCAADGSDPLSQQLTEIAARRQREFEEDVRDATAAPPPAVEEPPVEAEIVPDDEPAGLWRSILTRAAERGLSERQAEAAFARLNEGLLPAEAGPERLAAFLAAMGGGA
ncbi:hypothetical protein [Streptomyces sp. NBRC 109706]|uniref:recombination directionality factor n=1 Tax=Streptomyces sp. NBRC 109706 TaxID=1550035 RepID=UPI0007815BB5|nr:hypothetical protein [Streptomyces sp. NBRC 109706]